MALERCPCHPRQGGELLPPSPGTLPAPQPLGLFEVPSPRGRPDLPMYSSPSPSCLLGALTPGDYWSSAPFWTPHANHQPVGPTE